MGQQPKKIRISFQFQFLLFYIANLQLEKQPISLLCNNAHKTKTYSITRKPQPSLKPRNQSSRLITYDIYIRPAQVNLAGVEISLVKNKKSLRTQKINHKED